MTPFPLLTPDSLGAEQRELHSKITGGRRAGTAATVPVVDSQGRLAGPFNVLLYAPAVGDAVQHLGAQLRYASSLTPRERELATLLVAGRANCPYELYAHRRLATAAGIPAPVVEALAAGEVPPLLDGREQQLIDLCVQLLDGTYDAIPAATESLGERLVVELVVLVGYYQLLARLLDVAGVGAPEE